MNDLLALGLSGCRVPKGTPTVSDAHLRADPTDSDGTRQNPTTNPTSLLREAFAPETLSAYRLMNVAGAYGESPPALLGSCSLEAVNYVVTL